MPRQQTTVVIFVASPADVSDERAVLEQVISEINSTWSQEFSVRFELVRWETHAVPDLGSDAQDVVNRSIPVDYDVFIGIMWQRFGTPTQRAESGTLEEFRSAKARHDADPASVRVMIYFKDKPVAPSQLDLVQFQKVHQFKAELGSVGGLFWQFDDVSDFERLVRVHLQRVLQEFRDASQVGKPTRSATEVALALAEDEEPGIMDHLFEFVDRFAQAAEGMSAFTLITDEMSETLARRSEELVAAQSDRDLKRVKPLFGWLAVDLNSYADKLRAISTPFFVDFEAGMDAMIQFIEMYPKEEQRGDRDEELIVLIEQIGTARDAMQQLKNAMISTDQIIGQWPRMTKDLNVARRRLRAALEETLSGYERGDRLLRELTRSLLGLVAPPSRIETVAQFSP